MEAAILEAEAEVERLELVASDAALVNDHVAATKAYGAVSVAQELVKTLYARWAVLEQD